MKYKNIIEKMTLEEKASLLSGRDFWTTREVKRLNIPSIFLADGPHGLRKQLAASDHLGLNEGVKATCFPTATTIANSWDVTLGEEIGEYLGEEAFSLEVNVLLGPGLNIKRSPLCGRNFEYFSEDPYLSGKIAAAYIRGIQSKGVLACPKHFAANNQEFLRLASDSVVDERTLREIYLTGFEIAVKEGHPKAIMSAYNKINGVYANENEFLLQDILVKEWGFVGIVVSDWGGSNDHVAGVKAGSHLEMPSAGYDSVLQITEAVKNGTLEEELLDTRVDEYLRAISACQIKGSSTDVLDKKKHHNMAKKAAESSIVLLKNEDDILPLPANKKIAVIGDFARMPRYQGAGSSLVNPSKLTSSLNCLKSSGLNIIGYEQGFLRSGKKDEEKRKAACELAGKADVILLYLGLAEINETEGMDRTHIRLSKNQLELLDSIQKVNPQIVVVLSCGAAVEMSWISKVKGLLHGYLSGQAGAEAMTDILTGKCNPSGKLAETYPMKYEDTPAYHYYPGKERTAEYREGLYVGYRYYDTADVSVRLPFGFGLSYTTFAYSDITVSDTDVMFVVENTGNRAGAEIVQLYIHAMKSDIFRPYKELKGFQKVWLEPGEKVQMTLTFDDYTFRYFNTKTGKYEIEEGEYEILIGASSADIRLNDTLNVSGSGAENPYCKQKLKSYYDGKIRKIKDEEFENLLQHAIPESKWDRKQLLQRNDTVAQLFYAKSFLARVFYRILTGLKNKAERKGTPNLNILFIYYVPFRNIAKMTGGIFNMEMVDAVLTVVNGHFFKGMGQLLGAWRRKCKADRAMGISLGMTQKKGKKE